eukprot:CAMPEP_0168315436 /NCGR_PEP_ID=MMETSP0210-20121227/11265_1 /TAXON_ID=40633 /ORGANISM="Condylostoma magnum, Strain COL2" /LENGTH=36 /DNA_ID= /DNA_START= /DNA_END= /DNA_ORIENTATION=
MAKKDIKFVQGDRVIVIKGDIAGLTGKVKTIYDKTA